MKKDGHPGNGLEVLNRSRLGHEMGTQIAEVAVPGLIDLVDMGRTMKGQADLDGKQENGDGGGQSPPGSRT